MIYRWLSAVCILILSATPLMAQMPPDCIATTATGELLSMTITSPRPGSVEPFFRPCCDPSLVIRGFAGVGSLDFDFYFLLDSSGSTGACSGVDIDEDGVIGTPIFPAGCSDPDDSVLAAQVKAVGDFVDTISPDRARVALMQFSNPEGFIGVGERQRLVQTLTSDFSLVDTGLDTILAGGSAGATDYGGGMSLIINEFLTHADATRRQFAYFMSDGVPTFPIVPFDSEDSGDSLPAIDGADIAVSHNIVINSFGVGFFPSVTLDPVVPKRCLDASGVELSTLACIAYRTGGEFFESSNPADIVDKLRITLPDLGIDNVRVSNDTTGDSVLATLSPDSTWSAELPVKLKRRNDISVVVTANDGTTCVATTDVKAQCVKPSIADAVTLPGQPAAPFAPASPCSAGSF